VYQVTNWIAALRLSNPGEHMQGCSSVRFIPCQSERDPSVYAVSKFRIVMVSLLIFQAHVLNPVKHLLLLGKVLHEPWLQSFIDSLAVNVLKILRFLCRRKFFVERFAHCLLSLLAHQIDMHLFQVLLFSSRRSQVLQSWTFV